jgi:hypothetical protein
MAFTSSGSYARDGNVSFGPFQVASVRFNHCASSRRG